jgi:hypothetical protein
MCNKYEKTLMLSALLLLIFISCAKENLPGDELQTGTYNKLYFKETNTSLLAKTSVVLNVGAVDTTVFNSGVAIGGTTVAPKDIPISLTVLPSNYVESFNRENSTNYLLLPEGSYKIPSDTVIRAGQTGTGLIPLTITKSKLEARTTYILPIKFSTGDGTYDVDVQRQVSYALISTNALAIGIKIGNIPQLSDSRADLFDFYGDLMLKDTAGNLWVYPLESNGNVTIGEPVMVASGFTDYECMFFHPFYEKLFAIDIRPKSVGGGFPVSFTVTPYPNVEVGPVKLLATPWTPKLIDYPGWAGTANQDWGQQGYLRLRTRKFFAGVNGFSHILTYYSAAAGFHTKLDRLNTFGEFNTTNRRIQYSWSYNIRSACTINNVQLFLSTNLLVYGSTSPMAGNYPVYSYVNNVGDGLFLKKYAKMFSVKQKDLVFYEFDGDIVRYSSVDFSTYLTPTNVD